MKPQQCIDDSLLGYLAIWTLDINTQQKSLKITFVYPMSAINARDFLRRVKKMCAAAKICLGGSVLLMLLNYFYLFFVFAFCCVYALLKHIICHQLYYTLVRRSENVGSRAPLYTHHKPTLINDATHMCVLCSWMFTRIILFVCNLHNYEAEKLTECIKIVRRRATKVEKEHAHDFNSKYKWRMRWWQAKVLIVLKFYTQIICLGGCWLKQRKIYKAFDQYRSFQGLNFQMHDKCFARVSTKRWKSFLFSNLGNITISLREHRKIHNYSICRRWLFQFPQSARRKKKVKNCHLICRRCNVSCVKN